MSYTEQLVPKIEKVRESKEKIRQSIVNQEVPVFKEDPLSMYSEKIDQIKGPNYVIPTITPEYLYESTTESVSSKTSLNVNKAYSTYESYMPAVTTDGKYIAICSNYNSTKGLQIYRANWNEAGDNINNLTKIIEKTYAQLGIATNGPWLRAISFGHYGVGGNPNVCILWMNHADYSNKYIIGITFNRLTEELGYTDDNIIKGTYIYRYYSGSSGYRYGDVTAVADKDPCVAALAADDAGFGENIHIVRINPTTGTISQLHTSCPGFAQGLWSCYFAANDKLLVIPCPDAYAWGNGTSTIMMLNADYTPKKTYSGSEEAYNYVINKQGTYAIKGSTLYQVTVGTSSISFKSLRSISGLPSSITYGGWFSNDGLFYYVIDSSGYLCCYAVNYNSSSWTRLLRISWTAGKLRTGVSANQRFFLQFSSENYIRGILQHKDPILKGVRIMGVEYLPKTPTSLYTATPSDVVSGKTFVGNTGSRVKGTMTKRNKLTVLPRATTQNYGAGYYSEIQVNGDANLIAENIKKGVTIMGVTGTYKG